MRKLTKGPRPSVLSTSGDRLRDEYLEATREGQSSTPKPWQHPEIRRGLEDETNSRCVYCDSEIRSVAFPNIEHYRPRARFPELVVEWDNLTLACPRCNNAKRAKWNDELPFVNPFFEEPEDHIVFVGPIAKGKSPRGEYTVLEIDLNAFEVVQARDQQIEAALNIFRLWSAHAQSAAAQALYETQIRSFIETTPYQSAVIGALRSVNFPLTHLAA